MIKCKRIQNNARVLKAGRKDEVNDKSIKNSI